MIVASRRPSWQKQKKAGHRRPRQDRPTRPVERSYRKLILCLWSANGEPVTRIEAFGSATSAPPVCLHEQIRYDKVPNQHDDYAKIVHYQTRTLVSKVASS